MSGAGHKPPLEERSATARFFAENRSVALVILLLSMLWGAYSYVHLPRLKDPVIPVRVATATTSWPGMSAEMVERQVTRMIETTIAESSVIHPPEAGKYGIQSLSLPGVSIIQIQLDESVVETEREFDAINLKLDALNDQLPDGAGPISFDAGFGDTAALLLTIASPKESDIELEVRARDVAAAIGTVRAAVPEGARDGRVAMVVALPRGVALESVERIVQHFALRLEAGGIARDVRRLIGPGFVGVDAVMPGSNDEIRAEIAAYVRQNLADLRFHPDAWAPALIRDPADTLSALEAVRGDKYSYRQLDDWSELITRTLATVPLVSKIDRSGDLDRRVFLEYDQDRLASYGLQPYELGNVLSARNTTIPGGQVAAGDTNVLIEPTGLFTSPSEIGNVIATTNDQGSPVYLRDLVTVRDGYQSPPQLLNFYLYQDADGAWQRARAVSLAIFMRDNQQIGTFGAEVDAALADLGRLLPNDLIFEHTSDQPEQVADILGLFTRALVEAIVLVVIIAFLGFWEWRSAVLMMLSIPITLALTFGLMSLLGVQLQQVSVATLIIALGLLVDDPVVANDAIKRELAAGRPRVLAAWLGPTRLGKAIMFATVTNVVAYLPFLMLTGDQGDFLWSLPVVMSCALLSSRLVSMTFIPLLGYFLLRRPTKAEPSMETRRSRGFSGRYYRLGGFAIRHRKKVFAGSLGIIALGVVIGGQLKTSFFPDDIQRLFYIDVFLANGTSIAATTDTAKQVEEIVIREAAAYGAATPGDDGSPRQVLEAISTYIGGGAPRFWFSVTPAQHDSAYAQVLARVVEKNDTPPLVDRLQQVLSEEVPGTFIDVRQLQTNPVTYPVAVRLFGRATIATEQQDAALDTLIGLADRLVGILASSPLATRARHDWGGEVFRVVLDVNEDRANLAGITNQDIAASTSAGISGSNVGTMLLGQDQVPIVARLDVTERSTLQDLHDLYVYGSGAQSTKVPLLEVATPEFGLELQRLRRMDHFPMITVFAFPVDGVLPSQVFQDIADELAAFEAGLPPGFELAIDGEQAKQQSGFGQLSVVLFVSLSAIYLALVLQFSSAVKPVLVFMAVPYGAVGGLAGLYVMQSSFGYMAFLGMIALMGVIISHVIVLFDFIEEKREEGEPLELALLDAGIIRLRPVLITVGATVLALFPLAIEGGPLWQPLCYVQIGGLMTATVVTLILVPVFYAIFVLDLKIVRWEPPRRADAAPVLAPEGAA